MSVNVAATSATQTMQPPPPHTNTFSAGDLAAAHQQLEERLSQQAAQISQLSQLFGGGASQHGVAGTLGVPTVDLPHVAALGGMAAPAPPSSSLPQLPPMNVSFADSVNFGGFGGSTQSLSKNPTGGRMKNYSSGLGNSSSNSDAVSSEDTGVSGNHSNLPPSFSSFSSSYGAKGESPASLRKAQHRAQRRILLLRHAKLCPHTGGICPVSKQCGVAQKLCRHIEQCSSKKCAFPHCVSSRCLLSHYRRCNERSCGVCLPVKRAIRRSKEKQPKIDDTPTGGDDDNSLFKGLLD